MSALEPAGRAAEEIATLFWVMAVGALIIWAAMIALTIYALRTRRRTHSQRQAELLIVGGGVVFPTVTLAALLIYGLSMLPGLVAPAPEGSMKISVSGEQFWWRVRYFDRRGRTIELANEVRLPVGEPVEFQLESSDVIHSFWIPSLGGKVDMIPGRKTRLVLFPTRTGIFRGVCAEYCGSAHAMMAFDVVVSEKDEFERWLADQARDARVDPRAAKGEEVFLTGGCGACHTIRGTPARGLLGPDLTHVASRRALGAGTISQSGPDSFYRWITETEILKPGVHMPAFAMLPAEELDAVASYLGTLQ